MATNKPKVIFVPGNGVGDIEDCSWYSWAKAKIEALGHEVILKNFPEPITAKESAWIPFIRDELAKGDENIILIGHSSGAVASMRYLEKYKAVGVILISVYHTDLGMPSEAISGYFTRPWDYSTIGKNVNWMVQFASTDDPFVPIHEMRHVSENLSKSNSKFKYIEHNDKRHYNMSDIFPELVQVVKQMSS